MQMSGEQRIPARREQVWAALNDPAILKASIPGCETLEPVDGQGYKATVTARVGPVRAKFAGEVTLSDLDPPNGYTISGEGKGGAAGFARGSARVALADDGDGTLMRYEVDASVGGKLAQLGSRLIDGTARKLADEFFATFCDLAARAPADATALPGTPTAAPAEPPPTPAEVVHEPMPMDGGGAPEPPQAPSAPEPVPMTEGATRPVPESPRPHAETSPPRPETVHRDTPASSGATAKETEGREQLRREAAPPQPAGGLPSWIWAAGVIAIVIIGLLVFAA